MILRVLDLFSGIGGFSLGLERAGGFSTIAFCEIDPFCRKVLAARWPGVPIHEDVSKLTAAAVGNVDVICGGFPCQDISNAGHRAGIEGERSGLWGEYFRLICELRPRYVLVENVAALLVRGLGRVLGDLASVGYDAEWESIPACAVGAPHIRDRIWILAYPGQEPGSDVRNRGRNELLPRGDSGGGETEWRKDWELTQVVPGVHPGKAADWWLSQSSVARTADELPGQLDRCGALGNAVVPDIPELLGAAILEAEGMTFHSEPQGMR